MKKGFWILAAFLFPGCGFGDEVEVTYEFFSMPLRGAAAWQRERLGSEEMYRRVVEGVEKKGVGLESFMVLKAQDDGRGFSEGIEEMIYPTEYDPGDGLGGAGGLGGGLKTFRLPILPMPVVAPSYETKNLGEVIEFEVRKRNGDWEVRHVVSRVEFLQLDQIGRSYGMVEMPRFSVQALKSGVFVKPGKPTVLGTFSPPRNQGRDDGGRRVWLLFLTLREKGK